MRRGVFFVLAMAVLPACVSSWPSGQAGESVGPARPSEIVRTLDGGLIGRAGLSGIGRSDVAQALQAEYRALEYGTAGTPVTWRGGSSLSGEVIAAQPYRVGSQDCRSYIHTVRAANGERVLRGTACRNPDGSWTLLS